MTDEKQDQEQEEGRPIHGNLILALWSAQQEAPNVEPTRKHYDGYMYASNADVKDVLVPILHRHGLIFELAHVDTIMDEKELATSSGGVQWMTDALCTFRLSHVDSGQQQEYRILGRRTNDKDKGLQHAISSAEKTLLLRLLQVAEEKDEEGDAHRVAQSTGTRSRRQRGSQARRKDARAQGAPAPPPRQENGQPVPPREESSPDQIIEWAKARVRHHMTEGRFKSYHLEAVAQVDNKLRERIDVWNEDEWKHMEEVARRWPQRFDDAVKVMAEKEPTTAERLEVLSKLLDETPAGKLDARDGILIRTAADAGWHDAVEYWIQKLEDIK